ncbi:nucleic acid dioxygenase ALKBH1 isoform X1 [Folsomia candida]|uniref:nucleic acid dioxygenase ALKBH1 isoform X1 n=1 Tax=Folsomia candida TaxID=158441 RepID=UPI000B8F04C5|nr:nucleic acid dioxygenase ALKBH1 isoform X1 [Folsomia candida]
MISDQAESEYDLFKVSFKKFKLCKNPATDFIHSRRESKSHSGSLKKLDKSRKASLCDDEGIDTSILLDPTTGSEDDAAELWDKLLQERCLLTHSSKMTSTNESLADRLGLCHPSTWKVYQLTFPDGLILIRNPFTPKGQRYWIRRSVIDFPKSPHITNIDNLENKEGKSIKDKLDAEGFFKKLRWVTFGYHHNWDSKVYSEDNQCEFPPDLAGLTKFMAEVLGFPDFKAEASIANYYHLDSTLSGHVDRSEANQGAPLFSLSFGQPAVFLIGARLKSVKPQAILLRSGDVAVMSGESRLAYHGVPKIFQSKDCPWISSKIISPQTNNTNKRLKLEHLETNNDCSLNVDWTEFLSSYVAKSRINLNIRQVLFPGHTQLVESQSHIKTLNTSESTNECH